MAEKKAFHEPTGEEPAGFHVFRRPRSFYEDFIASEGIPIYHGIGVHDTRELELGPWKRKGGRGTYLDLSGIENAGRGMYVHEVPARGEVLPERHMYHETFLVIEGRGVTEIWREGSSRKFTFEWQPGSYFLVPINTWFRHINLSSSPALLVASNNAPPMMNSLQDLGAIFENPYEFRGQFDEGDEFFRPNSEVEAEDVAGRAAIVANSFPDVVNCEVPRDNQRGPGARRLNPRFPGFQPNAHTGGFVAQYPQGRYSKAHFHGGGAVLACLRGAGYTLCWPTHLGPRPWENGHGDEVIVQEYIPGGLVTANPGGETFFHQHFGVGSEPLRVIYLWNGPPTGRAGAVGETEGDEVKAGNVYGISEGGRAILYWEEDSYVREYFQDRLKAVGIDFTMPASVYEHGTTLSTFAPLAVQEAAR
jgi:quercetin dioxygenase-like cupin family protein